MDEMVDAVDENDKVVETLPRKEARARQLRIRVSRIIIINNKGELLIQKRAAGKDSFPSYNDFGVAETVGAGEEYLAAAIRGIKEEIGVHVDRLELLKKLEFCNKETGRHYYYSIFLLEYNGSIDIDEKEVESAGFYSVEELEQMMDKEKFMYACRMMLELYKETKEEQLYLIDEDDNVLGKAPVTEVRSRNLLHRGTAAVITNSKGEVLLHKRDDNKDLYPGKLCICIGGKVQYGETYEQGIIREAKEEIGVRIQPEFMFKVKYHGELNSYISHIFHAVVDEEITIDKSEIEWARFVTLEELEEAAKGNFCKDELPILEKYKEWRMKNDSG